MRIYLLLIAAASTCVSCHTQEPSNRLSIGIPTIEQEASYIWRTINDISFLEGQGYSIALPKAPLIDSLIEKSKSGAFGNEDYPAIYQLLESEVYNEVDYQAALEKVQQEEALINDLIQRIVTTNSKWDWEFKLFDSYPIVFTLYGSGGSYDPETGQVTLFTTPDGAFKNYKSPANTIIHEITHMGMEQSIVQKHQLPHGLKERIVDRFVFLMFQDDLPNYKVQNMGDVAIDEYLQRAADIAQLDAILTRFMK